MVIYRSKIIRLKCSLNRSYINYGELHFDSVNSSLVFFYPLDSVSLLTGARSSSLGNSFWTTVFGVFCYFQTRVTCRPKSRCQSDLSTVSVLANRSFHQDLMHSGCRGMAVPNVCLQAFSLFPLPSSPLDKRPVHRLYQTQKSTFSTLVSRPGVGRNYVIITGHCRYLQLVISLARVCNNGSLFQSNDYNLFLPGI